MRILRRIYRNLVPAKRLSDKISRQSALLASGTVGIDVGASYFPHVHWEAIRQCSKSCWIAIDPNSQNLLYLNNWHELYECSLISIPLGLASSNGQQTLHVTNIDSGSSLLKPLINDDWIPRSDPSYFFPVKLAPVECLCLETLFNDYSKDFAESPFWIKLDTQGSELSILRGLSKQKYLDNVVLIETECTLQRIPIMEGAGKFGDLLNTLEPLGFELASLDPFMSAVPKVPYRGLKARGILNECDAVFILSPSYALKNRPLNHNLSLVSAYLSYSLYHEASSHILRILNHFSEELDAELYSLLASVLRLLGVSTRKPSMPVNL